MGINWMSELPDDAYVAQVSIPGTHDSATGNGTSFDSMARTQDLSLAQQLELGIRAFDFRPKVNGNTLNAQHGVVNTKITFDDAMKNVIAQFLQDHPSEFIVLHVLYATGFDSDKTKYAQLLKALFESDELKDKTIEFRRDLTVGEMRGKILVLSRDRYADEPYFGGFFENWSEEFDNLSKRSRIIGASGSEMNNSKLFVQDRANTNGDNTEKNKFMTNLLDFTTRHRINDDPANIVWAMNFLSSYSKTSSSSSYRSNATVFNKAYVDYVESGSYIPGPAGIVMMDFVGADDTNGNASVKAVIDNNFRYLGAGTDFTEATGENPVFRVDNAWLQAEGMNYNCGDSKALPIIADFDGDGRMDFYCSGQSYDFYPGNNKWDWCDNSYMAFNKGFGHPYGFEVYDNSGVKRGEQRGDTNKEDHLPIVYGAQVRALTDLNQDGAVDFILWDCDGHGWGQCEKFTEYGDLNNQVFINNGDGSQFSPITGYPHNIGNNKHNNWDCSLPGKYHRLSVADANGDGYPDILMVTENGTTYENKQFSWYDANGTSLFINNGDNTFTRKFIASNRNFYATSLFGDFNCDGYPDILLNGYHDEITGADGVKIPSGYELVIMTNDGKGNFSVAYHSNDYTRNADDSEKELAIHVIDYDQDGKMDILLSGTTNKNNFSNSNGRDGKVAFILHNDWDGTEVQFTEVLTNLHPSSEAMARTSILADFNGDGFVDYLADGWGPNGDWSNGTYLSYSQGGHDNYALNNGVIHSMDYYGATVGEEQSWLTFGDIDGDGMLDIISPKGDSAPRVYLNRTLEGKNQVAQVPAAPTGVQVDYDKDAKRITVTWDKMFTKSGSKAIYNTYLRRLDGKARSASGTIMRVPADINTGKLKAYTEWSSFLPAENCFFDNLEDGNYEVGVQSVGYNYGASEFIPYQFTVKNGTVTGMDETAVEDFDATVNVYNMQGILIKQGVHSDDALTDLPAGIYVVGGKKMLKR